MASKLAMQIADDEWAAARQIMPIVTELTVLADDAQDPARDGAANGVAVTGPTVVDWNSVELKEHTDLVIAPLDDTEMTDLFGILVDDKDKEKKKRDAANAAAGSGVVDAELMKEAADDVDDENDDEMINVYDKDNPVIAVGKFFQPWLSLGCVTGLMQ